ncbi:MAG TPA: pitrilysin family protein [Phycisphaerales bacterium]|nr:pitrilysin family protein [Phycisphaerales bacterium]
MPRLLARQVLARVVAPAVLVCMLAGSALGQSLACEKYTLPNGMTVILHEDHSLPRATINTWYRVGARNEPPGRSGFAHLFEHLMFMGTSRVPGNGFDVLMETGGGANNASTSLDRTNYFSWGPSELLPTLLWLDADRLEDMGITMTQEKLDAQRDVVRNERRQTVENAPYGKAYEASYMLLYPVGHPYHNGVIGTHQDLEAAQVQDVKDFFASFYAPSNASLVVAGDFDKAAIKQQVAEMFGTLPAGNTAPQAAYPQPRLGKVLRTTGLDRVELPAVMYAYHSPAAYADGDAEMDLLASVLTDGTNSALYRRLVTEEKLASEVSAFQDSGALGSVFRIMVLARPGADLSRVEKVLDEELTKVARTGPDAEDLERRKRRTDMSLLNSVQSIESRADKLNTYEYYFGNPDSLQRDRDRYKNASPATVKAWASAVLRADSRLIQHVLPEEPERAASARDSRPAPGTASPFTPPAPEGFELPSGLKVQVFSKTTVPLVSVGLVITPEGAIDPSGKAGCAELMTSMLSEGTGTMTGEAFAGAVQGLGASFNASASHESVSASMTVLKSGLDEGFGLFSQAITTPRFDAADWERVHALHIDGIKQADEEPRAVAAKVSSRILWGDVNPYGTPTSGTVSTASSVSLEDAKHAWSRLVTPRGATLIFAGDITPDEARALTEKHLGSWKAGATEPLPAPKFDRAVTGKPGMRLYVVDRPGAVQTMIQFRAPSVRFNDASRVPLSMLNTILGGSFTSRLNQNLREDKHYTYGARSAFDLQRSLGQFTAGAAVQAEVTGPALKEFFAELSRIQSGDISADEAGKARSSGRDDTVSSFGTLSGFVAQAGTLAEIGMPWSTVADDFAAMGQVDASALNALAKSAVDMDRAVMVLVGDRALITEQLKNPDLKLDLPEPIFVNADGVRE